VVAAAIDEQLQPDPETSLDADRLAQRQTADQLVADALSAGRIDGVHVAELDTFSTGNTAMMVARVSTTLSFVVKVDRSPELVEEAYLLRRLASDPVLPAATRRAFPRIYAIDDEGPIYGYLMEDLSSFTPLHLTLEHDGGRTARRLIDDLWSSILEPAYRATRSTRLAPNVSEDYFKRSRGRLDKAVAAGELPAGDEPLRLVWDDTTLELAGGWSEVLDAADVLLGTVVPPYSTFVHGDPNPENVLWREDEDGNVEFRLIDPKTWWTGDYLFDVAKISHYVLVTAPVQSGAVPSARMVRERGTTILSFDRPSLISSTKVDDWIANRVGRFADDAGLSDCPGWQTRYQLALAANLLGIVGPRLAKGEVDLAWAALGEGLRTASPLVDETLKVVSWVGSDQDSRPTQFAGYDEIRGLVVAVRHSDVGWRLNGSHNGVEEGSVGLALSDR
jgi:Phosphotransferase enzyme family